MLCRTLEHLWEKYQLSLDILEPWQPSFTVEISVDTLKLLQRKLSWETEAELNGTCQVYTKVY